MIAPSPLAGEGWGGGSPDNQMQRKHNLALKEGPEMQSIRVANAPCSWGVLEFDLDGEPAGYERVLSEMTLSGYEGTEFGDWGFLPAEAAQLEEVLKAHSLELLGAFVPVALSNPNALNTGIETALKTARLLSKVSPSPFIVLADDNGKVEERTRCAGRIQPGQGLNDDEWHIFANGAEYLARAVRDQTGLRTVFHHHCAGYIETPHEVGRLLELTDPGLIGLCLDTGHYTYGGGNALEGLQRHKDRIWHVHFKDCEPSVACMAREQGWDYFKAVSEGVFCELGKGEVDFPKILKQLWEWNYQGWIVVEQDVLPGMGSPLESAQRNRHYLRSLGL